MILAALTLFGSVAKLIADFQAGSRLKRNAGTPVSLWSQNSEKPFTLVKMRARKGPRNVYQFNVPRE